MQRECRRTQNLTDTMNQARGGVGVRLKEVLQVISRVPLTNGADSGQRLVR